MSFWEEGESLTLEKFQAMAAFCPRPEWMAFTVNMDTQRETKHSKLRDAVHRLVAVTGEPVSRVSMHLIGSLPELERAELMVKPFESEMKIAVEKLTAEMEKIRAASEIKPGKRNRNSNQPFYTKFLNKKRR